MSRSRAPRLIGGILKAVFILLIMTVCAILLWRVLFSGDPRSVKKLAVNPTLAQAYAEHGNDLVLQYQNQATITRAEDCYGYFSVTRCVFIPQANQVQIVFRYNNSTLRHLKEDYGLAKIPEKSGTYYDVTLLRTTDLTPDDPDDNFTDPASLACDRYFANAEPVRTETALYTYFRYTFDNVTVEDLTDGVYVDVYYLGDLNYEEKPYGTLCIYDTYSEWIPYRLTGADRKALAAAGSSEQNGK